MGFGSLFNWALICAASGGLPPLAHAEAQISEAALDVERYVEIVLRHHPAAAQVAAVEAAAAAERARVRLFPDPRLELQAGRARELGAAGSDTETGIGIAQTIPWPAAFSAGRRAGMRSAEALLVSADALRWDLSIQARSAFARLLGARRLAEIARGAEADARSLHDLVTRRAELGETRESERIRTQVEWLRQRRRLQAAEREAAAAEAILRALAGEPLPEPLALLGELPRPKAPLDLAALRERLTDLNPTLRQAQAEEQRRRALLALAEAQRWPDLELGLARENELDKHATSFSVGVRLPLWNAGRGEIAAAQAAADTAAAALQRARLDLDIDLEARLKELESAAGQVEILEGEIVPAAAASTELARFSYEEGETSLLDLLDAQRTLRDAQIEAVDSRLALAGALAEIQRLVGPDFDPWRMNP